MHIIFLLLFILAAVKWGDWKNWERYYPTFLFFMIGDLLYQYLLFNNTMWAYHPSFDSSLLPNHTFISLAKMVIQYSTTIAIFLGLFPSTRYKQIMWILLWTIIFLTVEVIELALGIMSHHNKWSVGWSIYFDIVLFTILAVHYFRPGLAWILSALNVVFLWNVFELPLNILK